MNIKTTNFVLDSKTREYLNKKVDSLSKFINPNDDSINLDIELGKTTEHHQKGDIYRAEFNLSVGGEFYRTEENSEDILSSIDLAIEELSKQLRRYKTKKETLFKRGAGKIKEMIHRFDPRKNNE